MTRRRQHLSQILADPEAARAVVALLAISALAGVLLWGLAGRSGDNSFPRRDFQFLPAPALEAQLKATLERLESNPEDIRALVEAGRLHFQKGKEFYPVAINELEEARRLGSTSPQIFYYLGVMYQEEGLYPYAVASYQRFLRNVPEDRETRLLLAKLLYQNGRFEEAAEHYRLLLRRRSDPVVEENLALSLVGAKRAGEAAEILEKLSERPAWRRRAHFHLGQMALESQDWERAREHFERVKPVDGAPDLEGLSPLVVHNAMATVYDKLKVTALAQSHWEEILKLDPKHAKAKAALRAIQSAQRLVRSRSSSTRKK